MDKLTALYQQFDPGKPLEAAETNLYVDWQPALLLHGKNFGTASCAELLGARPRTGRRWTLGLGHGGDCHVYGIVDMVVKREVVPTKLAGAKPAPVPMTTGTVEMVTSDACFGKGIHGKALPKNMRPYAILIASDLCL